MQPIDLHAALIYHPELALDSYDNNAVNPKFDRKIRTPNLLSRSVPHRSVYPSLGALRPYLLSM